MVIGWRNRQVLFFFIKQLIVLVILFYCLGATGSLHHLLCIVGSTLVPCLHRRVYDLPCFGRVRTIPRRLIGTRISDSDDGYAGNNPDDSGLPAGSVHERGMVLLPA